MGVVKYIIYTECISDQLINKELCSMFKLNFLCSLLNELYIYVYTHNKN